MKECLACWEEIEDTEEVCPYCGSKQEEVKDYLALVLLKQGKKKISVPKETPVLDFILDTDPQMEEEISVSIKSPSQPETKRPAIFTSQAGKQSDGTYVPEQPSWLAKPVETDLSNKEPVPKIQKETKTTPVPSSTTIKTTAKKVKTILCPKCGREVPLLQYCKFCGQQLTRNCPACNKEIAVTAKFCRGCGIKLDPFLDKTETG